MSRLVPDLTDDDIVPPLTHQDDSPAEGRFSRLFYTQPTSGSDEASLG